MLRLNWNHKNFLIKVENCLTKEFICAISFKKLESLIFELIPEKEEIALRDPIFGVRDKGGRRSGSERRRFPILEYAPERRSGQERRDNQDRRNGTDSDEAIYLKRNADRYMEFANTQKG